MSSTACKLAAVLCWPHSNRMKVPDTPFVLRVLRSIQARAEAPFISSIVTLLRLQLAQVRRQKCRMHCKCVSTQNHVSSVCHTNTVLQSGGIHQHSACRAGGLRVSSSLVFFSKKRRLASPLKPRSSGRLNQAAADMGKHVGFLGLGIMGEAMARNLLNSGDYESVTVWNRTLDKVCSWPVAPLLQES